MISLNSESVLLLDENEKKIICQQNKGIVEKYINKIYVLVV